jgi:AraC family transcriptional regulator
MSDRPFLGRSIRALRVDGISLSEDVYGAATALPVHVHDASFLSLTLSGAYVEDHGRRRLRYTAGDVAFHPPGEEHSVAVERTELRCLNVGIEAEWIDRLRELRPAAPRLVHSSGGTLQWLATRLHECLRAEPEPPLAVAGLVAEVLGAVGGVEDWSADRRPPAWLHGVEERLRGDFTQPLTIGVLAREAGVHAIHLSRTWRRFRRCSIAEFVHRLRIEAACRRIVSTPVALADLALEVGFADQSQFSRAFKRVTGTTPGRYRAAFRSRSVSRCSRVAAPSPWVE